MAAYWRVMLRDDYVPFDTVKAEFFMRTLLSRLTLKDMFAMLKISDWNFIYLHQ